MFVALLLSFALAEVEDEPAVKPAAVVEMTQEAKFVPAKVKIKVGETVQWKHVSGPVHTVTADPAKAKDKSNVMLPKGAAPFDSGNIRAGGTFSHTFTVAGHYKYFCIPHEMKGMVGEVEVVAADATP